jgi:hypothetical protein
VTFFPVRAAIAAGLLLGIARGEEPQRDSPPPPEPAGEGGNWFDLSHRFLERELSGLTERVDDFFGDERDPELEAAGSFVHVRNELRIAEDKLLAFRVRALASVKLPALERWLANARLVASGESQAAPSPDLAQDPASPARSPSLRAEQAGLELRLDLYDAAPTVVDVGAGVRIRLPPEPFVRSRYRRRLEPGLGIAGRFTQSVFWTNRERFGESTELSLDRPLGPHTLVRSAAEAVLSEVSPGLVWSAEMGLLHELTALRTAAYLAEAATGHTRPAAQTDLYKTFLRLRRDVWRRWLFVEVEPEVGWPWTPGRGRHRVLAITLRLEVQIHGRARQAAAEP